MLAGHGAHSVPSPTTLEWYFPTPQNIVVVEVVSVVVVTDVIVVMVVAVGVVVVDVAVVVVVGLRWQTLIFLLLQLASSHPSQLLGPVHVPSTHLQFPLHHARPFPDGHSAHVFLLWLPQDTDPMKFAQS